MRFYLLLFCMFVITGKISSQENSFDISDDREYRAPNKNFVYTAFQQLEREEQHQEEGADLSNAFVTYINFDVLPADFSEFDDLLGSYNTKLLGKANITYGFEMGLYRNDYYFGFNLGFAYSEDTDHDSLSLEVNTTQYGFHFGYNILDSKNLLITPKVAMKWNRYRLINASNEENVTLSQYMEERDLDLRFNQFTGFAGLSVSYKFYDANSPNLAFWTVGLYAGYSFRLHRRPWLNSLGNNLNTSSTINFKSYNWGFYFAMSFTNTTGNQEKQGSFTSL